MKRLAYNKVSGGYIIAEDYSIQLSFHPEKTVISSCGFIIFYEDGLLLIKAGFYFDGATFAIDSDGIIRPAGIHDALYKLFREGLLPSFMREDADKALSSEYIKDALQVKKWIPKCLKKFRANYVLKGVDWFGSSAADPKNKRKIFYAPC
jgi:hypothetical protein